MRAIVLVMDSVGIGSAPGVAEDAANVMRVRFPGCSIVGTRDGYFQPSDSQSEHSRKD